MTQHPICRSCDSGNSTSRLSKRPMRRLIVSKRRFLCVRGSRVLSGSGRPGHRRVHCPVCLLPSVLRSVRSPGIWSPAIGTDPLLIPRGFCSLNSSRRQHSQARDDSAGRDLARRELRRMKQQRRLTLFLSGVGATRGYRVFDDRVVRIPTSTVPMLAYRLLGFGGRMFAVPFVDRQIEWLLVDPPQDVPVP